MRGPHPALRATFPKGEGFWTCGSRHSYSLFPMIYSCRFLQHLNKSEFTSSSRTASPGIRPGGGVAEDTTVYRDSADTSADRDSAGTGGAGGGRRRRGGNPASRRPPGSRIHPRPAAPLRTPPVGRGFQSSPGGMRIRPAAVLPRSARRRTRARARRRPDRSHIPSGDKAAYSHKPYSQRLSIAARFNAARRR